MKPSPIFFVILLGAATVAFVAARSFVGPPEAANPGLGQQAKRMSELLGDAANVSANVHHALKASPAAGDHSTRGADSGITELERIIEQLNENNAAQQKTISDLIAKQSSGGGFLDRTVTLVGLSSTLLAMWLSWRKDHREIEELRGKLKRAHLGNAAEVS